MSYIKRWVEDNMYESLESASNKKSYHPSFLYLSWLGLGILNVLATIYLLYGVHSVFKVFVFGVIVWTSSLIGRILIDYTRNSKTGEKDNV